MRTNCRADGVLSIPMMLYTRMACDVRSVPPRSAVPVERQKGERLFTNSTVIYSDVTLEDIQPHFSNAYDVFNLRYADRAAHDSTRAHIRSDNTAQSQHTGCAQRVQ